MFWVEHHFTLQTIIVLLSFYIYTYISPDLKHRRHLIMFNVAVIVIIFPITYSPKGPHHVHNQRPCLLPWRGPHLTARVTTPLWFHIIGFSVWHHMFGALSFAVPSPPGGKAPLPAGWAVCKGDAGQALELEGSVPQSCPRASSRICRSQILL